MAVTTTAGSGAAAVLPLHEGDDDAVEVGDIDVDAVVVAVASMLVSGDGADDAMVG
jgi:hypothetical protein